MSNQIRIEFNIEKARRKELGRSEGISTSKGRNTGMI